MSGKGSLTGVSSVGEGGGVQDFAGLVRTI